MRRLPAVLSFAAIALLVLAAAEAPAVTSAEMTKEETLSVAASLKGTFLFTQELYLPTADAAPAEREGEVIPFVDVSHIDDNLEIRTLSGVFHENGCGKVLAAGVEGAFTVPFNASMGVGDWSAYRDWSIKAVYIHVLYDCTGRPIGYAWVMKQGSPVWLRDLLPPDGEGGPDTPPEQTPNPPAKPEWDSDFVGWQGQTTIKFFDLKGAPMIVPVPGIEAGVSELSGPFQALRVTGEPHR